ncbi:T9SS type A sorting domain-containing protein [bacterium]|nr:T9SS type A sorting domain-containing protein [bacterium]
MKPQLPQVLPLILCAIVWITGATNAFGTQLAVLDSMKFDVSHDSFSDVVRLYPDSESGGLYLLVRLLYEPDQSKIEHHKIYRLIASNDGSRNLFIVDSAPDGLVQAEMFHNHDFLYLSHGPQSEDDTIMLERSAMEPEYFWRMRIDSTSAGQPTRGVGLSMLETDEFLVLLQAEDSPVLQRYSPGGTLLAELVLDGIGEAWDLAWVGRDRRGTPDGYPLWLGVAGSEGQVWVDAMTMTTGLESAATDSVLYSVDAEYEVGYFGRSGTSMTWYGEEEVRSFNLPSESTLVEAYWPGVHAATPVSDGGFVYQQIEFGGLADWSVDATEFSLRLQTLLRVPEGSFLDTNARLIFTGTTEVDLGADSSRVDLMLVTVGYAEDRLVYPDKARPEPHSIDVYPAFPNPFNGKALVRLAVATEQQVEARVYNVLGRLVATPLQRSALRAGFHSMTIVADGWASGTYVLVVEGEANQIMQQKITLIR